MLTELVAGGRICFFPFFLVLLFFLTLFFLFLKTDGLKRVQDFDSWPAGCSLPKDIPLKLQKISHFISFYIPENLIFLKARKEWAIKHFFWKRICRYECQYNKTTENVNSCFLNQMKLSHTAGGFFHLVYQNYCLELAKMSVTPTDENCWVKNIHFLLFFVLIYLYLYKNKL